MTLRTFTAVSLAPALLAALLIVPARAATPLGYPGSTWGEATRDADDFEGWGTQGWVRQGVDWLALPKGHTLSTYGEASWRFRSNHTTYYDAWGPGAGLEVRGPFYSVALAYNRQRWTELDHTDDKLALLATWYKDWELTSKPRRVGRLDLAFPGATWGALSHSFDGLEGTGSQGFVNQGVRWAVLPGGVAVATIAEYRWRARELNRLYYDAHGPALGLEFKRSPLRAGVEYFWQFFPGTGERRERALFFLDWYYAWDLKRARRG